MWDSGLISVASRSCRTSTAFVKTRRYHKTVLTVGNLLTSWGVLSQVGRCPVELAIAFSRWRQKIVTFRPEQLSRCAIECALNLPRPDRVMSGDKTSQSLFSSCRFVAYNNITIANQRAEILVINWSVSRTTPLLKTLFKWDQQRSQAIPSRTFCSSFFSVPVATLWWGDLLLCKFIGNPLETKGWRKT